MGDCCVLKTQYYLGDYIEYPDVRRVYAEEYKNNEVEI